MEKRNSRLGQVRMSTVNQIYVIHKAMNGCKLLKIH